MGDFVYISVAALFCYIFLLLTFIAAKKNKIIYSFLIIIVAMILWTGGSLLMRMQLWPSIKFWYDISLLGLTLMPFVFYKFIHDFIGLKGDFYKILWLALIVLINVINIATGFFLPHPDTVVSKDGVTTFIYNTSWHVYILFAVCSIITLHIFYILIKNIKNNETLRKQFAPIIIGIVILFAGNVVVITPFLKGFPIDILAGVINAFFMFYALYRRRLFKLTLLVSRGSCYAIAVALSIFIFTNAIKPIEEIINKYFAVLIDYYVIIIAVCFTLAIFSIYLITKNFFDKVFIKEEVQQAENIKKFSLAVSKSLHVNEILDELMNVIHSTINVEKIYVCVFESDDEGDYYKIAGSTSALDEKNFVLKRDNPIITWLSEHNECLITRDFKKTIAYKSMWEEEKKSITDLGLECFAPLKDEDNLVGVILLSHKEKNANYNYDDISFLESVGSVGSIAIKNSKLYEKAYYEARTDELTGLLNRKYFYEIIQMEYEKNRDCMSLVILNIDDFKLYNQLYGNKEGDMALQSVAQIIKCTVGSNGYVARYSGKEFAIVLPGYDVLSAKNLADNIRKQINNMNKRGADYTLKALTVSGGICSIPHAASNVKQLIDYADMSVYNAKRKGKNNICVYAVDKKAMNNITENTGEITKVDIYSEYASTIYALTAAIDAKDHYTFNHSKSVANYATKLAFAFGMSEEHVKIIKEAALLHDIGKIGIPEHILNKQGKLTVEEYETIKGHVENSIGIIRHLPSLDYVIPAVIGHHERFDGHGYPRRIAGEDIPLSARILCIADAFDAMISQRSYKEPYTVTYALEILEDQAGLQFDPKLVRIFTNLVRDGLIRVNEEES